MSSTAALESFGAAPAALPGEVEIVDPSDPGGPEDLNAPLGRLAVGLTKDGQGEEPVHLGTRQLETIRSNLASAPTIPESALAAEFSVGTLGAISGSPGSKVADLYSEVLRCIKMLKTQAASTAK